MIIFDEEISILYNGTSSDPTCSVNLSSNRKVMLRITSENVDGQKSFSLDIYDSNDVKFLYNGIYNRHKFDEIRQAQNLKYNFEKATDKIISTVKETKSNPNVFISFSVNRKVGWFELKRRDDHTDYAVFKLELEKINDSRLIDHLICFIENFKKKNEEMKYFGRQCDQLTLENKKLTDELKTKTLEHERQLQELRDEKEEGDLDLRQKDDQIQTLEDEVDRYESDLNALKMSYEEVIIDNQKFVEELDEKDEKINILLITQDELKQDFSAIEQKLHYQINVNKSLKEKLFELTNESSNLKIKFDKHERNLQQELVNLKISEEKLKADLEKAQKELEALQIHNSLIASQLAEAEQKLSEKTRLELERAKLTNKRVFNPLSINK